MSDKAVDINIEGPEEEAKATDIPVEEQEEKATAGADEPVTEENADETSGADAKAGASEEDVEAEAAGTEEEAGASEDAEAETPETEEEAGTSDESDPATEKDSDDGAEEDGDARYLRLLAEFQNYKKRVEKEKSGLYSYANEKIMTELLEVMDNFERALEQGESDGFKEGMEMIFDQLGKVLEKEGLAEIDALGEDFDPNIHNAVMTEETDEYESGKVSGVMQKGYTLNGKVIRPSMVKVAE